MNPCLLWGSEQNEGVRSEGCQEGGRDGVRHHMTHRENMKKGETKGTGGESDCKSERTISLRS